jgi:hypothetical protein
MVNWLINAPASNRGKARIPMLSYKSGEADIIAVTNSKKGTALAKGFFPQKPSILNNQEEIEYPQACTKVGKVIKEQIYK